MGYFLTLERQCSGVCTRRGFSPALHINPIVHSVSIVDVFANHGGYVMPVLVMVCNMFGVVDSISFRLVSGVFSRGTN